MGKWLCVGWKYNTTPKHSPTSSLEIHLGGVLPQFLLVFCHPLEFTCQMAKNIKFCRAALILLIFARLFSSHILQSVLFCGTLWMEWIHVSASLRAICNFLAACGLLWIHLDCAHITNVLPLTQIFFTHSNPSCQAFFAFTHEIPWQCSGTVP